MRNIEEFGNFKNTINEETTTNLKGYTKDDVETAFRSIEDNLHEYYSIDENSAKIVLEWTLKYGSLDVESALDHVEFEFDISGFTRELIRNLSQDPDSKGPRFDKGEIERSIVEANHRFYVFPESIDFNINEIETTLEVSENRYSTELTVTGKIETDSLDLSEAKIDTDTIIERITEELLSGIARRIDFT